MEVLKIACRWKDARFTKVALEVEISERRELEQRYELNELYGHFEIKVFELGVTLIR